MGVPELRCLDPPRSSRAAPPLPQRPPRRFLRRSSAAPLPTIHPPRPNKRHRPRPPPPTPPRKGEGSSPPPRSAAYSVIASAAKQSRGVMRTPDEFAHDAESRIIISTISNSIASIGDEHPPSRDAFRARVMLQFPPSPDGGREEGRALAAPVARLQTKSRRQSPQVWPNTPGPPRAMVLTGYSALFLVHRAFWPPCSAMRFSRITLDTSFGVSEPHAFTVRETNGRPCSSHAAARVHRSPLPTSVTTANRPLPCNGMDKP
ncbi:hypothetical protein ACVILH_003440 [Bradyrhizobium sp. USDA 4353]